MATTSAISIGSGATFRINQSDTVTQGADFSGLAVSGAAVLLKLATGPDLECRQYFTGDTLVSGGTLLVNKTRLVAAQVQAISLSPMVPPWVAQGPSLAALPYMEHCPLVPASSRLTQVRLLLRITRNSNYEFNSLALSNFSPLGSGDLLNISGDLIINSNVALNLIDFSPTVLFDDFKLTLISYSGTGMAACLAIMPTIRCSALEPPVAN